MNSLVPGFPVTVEWLKEFTLLPFSVTTRFSVQGITALDVSRCMHILN